MMKANAIRIELKGNTMTFVFDEDKFPEVFKAYGELINQLNILKAGKDVEGANALF